MPGYKCMECGASVPPDEAQVVDDLFDAKLTIALGPFANLVDETRVERTEDGGYCTACFHKHDAADPLIDFVRKMMTTAIVQYLKDKTQRKEPPHD
jgi:hypothetical protein